MDTSWSGLTSPNINGCARTNINICLCCQHHFYVRFKFPHRNNKQHLISRQHAQPQSRKWNWTVENQRVVQTESFIVLLFPLTFANDEHENRDVGPHTTHRFHQMAKSTLENTKFSSWGSRHLARVVVISPLCDLIDWSSPSPKPSGLGVKSRLGNLSKPVQPLMCAQCVSYIPWWDHQLWLSIFAFSAAAFQVLRQAKEVCHHGVRIRTQAAREIILG